MLLLASLRKYFARPSQTRSVVQYANPALFQQMMQSSDIAKELLTRFTKFGYTMALISFPFLVKKYRDDYYDPNLKKPDDEKKYFLTDFYGYKPVTQVQKDVDYLVAVLTNASIVNIYAMFILLILPFEYRKWLDKQPSIFNYTEKAFNDAKAYIIKKLKD